MLSDRNELFNPYAERSAVKSLFRSPIFWRMMVWTFLLALAPLAIVAIFMQKEVNSAMDNLYIQDLKNGAHIIAAEIANGPERAQKIVNNFSVPDETVFILDESGKYLAHTNPQKIGQSASGDFSKEAIQKILSGNEGVFQPTIVTEAQNAIAEPVIGFARVGSQDLFVAIAVQRTTSTSIYNQMFSRVSKQLIVALLITSLIGGVGVSTIIIPLIQLSGFADRLGMGKLEERIETEDMEGEFTILANSLNSFAERVLQSIRTLEQRVAERTHDLQIASHVVSEITRVLDLQELLPRLVNLTNESYKLYFTSVYIYDESSRSLILQAGTGIAGEKMKAAHKAVSIDDVPSRVAQAGRERQPVVINDVSSLDAFIVDPQLPETCSEVAFPMLIQHRLIGVLNAQSKTAGYFTDEFLQVLGTLAEQIAIAITNARLFEEQKKVAEELRRVDEMKSQFLASMSHELRTPMNAIINFVDAVSSGLVGPLNDEQKDLLGQSLQSSQHLLHLINDVLDISKIQAGRLTLFVENDVNLYTQLKAVMEIANSLLQEKGKALQLVNDIDDNLPVICGDKRRIRQILLNLLSNAIKFTEKGTITLSVKNHGNRVVFTVIDTGPGIPEEAQEMIFEPFRQTMDGIKQVEGTGLGLPIARSLVEAHGGRMWLESQPGEGAAFYFDLPVS